MLIQRTVLRAVGLVAGMLACLTLAWDDPTRAASDVIGTQAFLPLVNRPYQLCFQTQGGAAIVEVEAQTPAEAWAVETAFPGYTGDAYYTWRGPDLYGSPGVAVLTYWIEIAQAGHYQLRLRNLHVHPDSTMANDVFTRMNDGAWVKTFSPERGVWTWATWFELPDHSQDPTPGYDLVPGRHRFEIAPRSADFSLDRFVLFLEGVDVLDPGLPPSAPCR